MAESAPTGSVATVVAVGICHRDRAETVTVEMAPELHGFDPDIASK